MGDKIVERLNPMTEARAEKLGEWVERKFDKRERPAGPRQSLDEIFREQDERVAALKEQERADREKQQAPGADSPPPAAVAPEPDAPGFTWDDAPPASAGAGFSPDLPKPLKAPPLKKGGAKSKTPPPKRRGKKPEIE